MKSKRIEPVEGINPIDMSAQMAERVAGKAVHSMTAVSRVERMKEHQVPTAAKNAWEREQQLNRGAKTSGGPVRIIRVKSISCRARTEVIDDVILHFDETGVAEVLAGYRGVIEAYMAHRPGRLTIEEVPQAPTASELLVAAKAAMAETAVPEVLPQQVEEQVAKPPVKESKKPSKKVKE